MRETTPSVRLIAHPLVDWEAVKDYLTNIGGLEWYDRMDDRDPSDGEVLTEFGGRLCYRSWTEGLNPNVTQVRKDSAKYFDNLLASGHGSVLEHANYTFLFEDVSRVFTHELVRHRAGVAISQESMRYVRFDDIPFRIPPILREYEEDIKGLLTEIEETYMRIMDRTGLLDDNNKMPMREKKILTSALRRILPDGVSTCVVWTANIRALRHVIKMRTAPDAEEEIRLVFLRVGEIMKEECPLLFADFEPVDGAWVPKYVKV